MQKDFNSWNAKKQTLDQTNRPIYFKESEIWWCAVGLNIGEEVYGKGQDFSRPVIIFRKLSMTSCIVIPTTTQPRTGSWYHHLFVKDLNRWAMMSQMRVISANRLYTRESRISIEQFSELKKSVAKLLGLS